MSDTTITAALVCSRSSMHPSFVFSVPIYLDFLTNKHHNRSRYYARLSEAHRYCHFRQVNEQRLLGRLMAGFHTFPDPDLVRSSFAIRLKSSLVSLVIVLGRLLQRTQLRFWHTTVSRVEELIAWWATFVKHVINHDGVGSCVGRRCGKRTSDSILPLLRPPSWCAPLISRASLPLWTDEWRES